MSEAAIIEMHVKPCSPWGEAGRRLLREPAGWISFAVLALLGVLAAFGPALAHGECAGVLDALRATLWAGLSAGFVALVIGAAWGAIAAASPSGGLMMYFVRVLKPIPLILFLPALVSVMASAPNARFVQLALAIGATHWMPLAVLTRTRLAALWRTAFVEAARAGGMRAPGIFVWHIAPNLSGIVAVAALEVLAHVVLIESMLSFLGLGLGDSLGALLSVSVSQPETVLLFWAPVALLFATLLALTLAGRRLRAALEGADT